MNFFAKIPVNVYKLLLIGATALWGYAFVVMKDVVAVIPPAWLLGIRFTLAGIIIAFFLRKQIARILSLKVIAMGLVLAVLEFIAFYTQTVGLIYTTPGINAFLTATYCVIVPFVWWVVGRKRPTVFNIGAALIALVGIWFVSVSSSGEGLSLGLGEGLTLVCALFFAFHIVAVARFSRFANALVLTAIQFLFEGMIALGVGAVTEPMPTLDVFTTDVILQLAFLVVFASVICFGIQNVALAYVPPAQASLFLSLESVFGVIFSILIYGEEMTIRLVAGFVLIFIAILISELFPRKPKVKANGSNDSNGSNSSNSPDTGQANLEQAEQTKQT